VWAAFALLPILVITINLTVVFGSDTYILNTVAGLYLCIAIVAKNYCAIFEKKNVRVLLIIFFVLLFGFFLRESREVSRAWETDLLQTTRAVKIEPSPVVLSFHIQNLMRANDYPAAFNFSQRLMEWDPNFKIIDQLYASSLYRHPSIGREEKIKLLEEQLKNYPKSPWIKYFLASLYAAGENFSDAAALMESISAEEFGIFKAESSVIAAEISFFNQKAKVEKAKFETKLDQIKTLLKKDWNEDLYQARKRELFAH
jgi:hypothetical protein